MSKMTSTEIWQANTNALRRIARILGPERRERGAVIVAADGLAAGL
jgi:hypothetical protein